MAVSGVILIGFVIVHLLGNLQIFLGPEAINSYAKKLADLGALLWVGRIVLIVAFFAHIYFGIRLKIENRAARGGEYEYTDTLKATVTSRTMMLSGLLIFAYIIYHLMHFTFTTLDPSYAQLTDDQGRHDVYRMMVMGFSKLPVTLTYLLAMVFLAAHLHHGASSVFQSLGVNDQRWQRYTAWVGPTLAFLIFIGYSSIPVAVLAGWVK